MIDRRYILVLTRYGCDVCGREREIVRGVEYNDRFPDGIPSFRWAECPEHPTADSHEIPTINLETSG